MRNVRSKAKAVTIGKARGALAFSLLASAAILGLLSTNQAQVQTCTPPPPNMVSWWSGDGNANDIRGSSNGTLQLDLDVAAGQLTVCRVPTATASAAARCEGVLARR